jgi:hypothetical protein
MGPEDFAAIHRHAGTTSFADTNRSTTTMLAQTTPGLSAQHVAASHRYYGHSQAYYSYYAVKVQIPLLSARSEAESSIKPLLAKPSVESHAITLVDSLTPQNPPHDISNYSWEIRGHRPLTA